jgi:hypothetical protein
MDSSVLLSEESKKKVRLRRGSNMQVNPAIWARLSRKEVKI